MAFTTGMRGDPTNGGSDFGSVEVETPPAFAGTALLSFSACPGDFRTPPAANTGCRIKAVEIDYELGLA